MRPVKSRPFDKRGGGAGERSELGEEGVKNKRQRIEELETLKFIFRIESSMNLQIDMSPRKSISSSKANSAGVNLRTIPFPATATRT